MAMATTATKKIMTDMPAMSVKHRRLPSSGPDGSQSRAPMGAS
jgi:hypothetical protein